MSETSKTVSGKKLFDQHGKLTAYGKELKSRIYLTVLNSLYEVENNDTAEIQAFEGCIKAEVAEAFSVKLHGIRLTRQ